MAKPRPDGHCREDAWELLERASAQKGEWVSGRVGSAHNVKAQLYQIAKRRGVLLDLMTRKDEVFVRWP